MDFDEGKKFKKIGGVIGYVVMYFVFTTVLYFLLLFLGKLPADWTYFHIVLITIFIVLLGILIKFVLK